MKTTHYRNTTLSTAMTSSLAVMSMMGALGAFQSVSAQDVALPASAALPLASVGVIPGFTARVVQAPEGTAVKNNYLRAVQQLNGTLVDTNGVVVGNIATLGGNPDGSYDVDPLDFGTDRSDPIIPSGLFETDILFPGLADEIAPEGFSTEVVTYLKLSAGSHTFGITAGYDRTDVVDDDGWRLFVGANPRSFFSTPVAEYQRTAPPFTAGANTNEFTLVAPVDGVYPFRLVHWQTGHKTMLEWYVVTDPGTEAEVRYLVNDVNFSEAIAFRSVNAAAAKTPFVAEVSPLPESSGVSPSAPVSVVLQDGEKPVDIASVKLSLNGVLVTPQTIQRVGNQVRLEYKPNVARVVALNTLKVDYKDTAGVSATHSWQFTITVSGAPRTVVKGQWEFDQGNLSATVGRALEYLDGANGVSATKTEFGTTTSFGIPDISGVPAKVVKVPGDLDRNIGYKMFHGISPNGGGTLVNQYTLIMDIYVERTGGGAASLLQTSSLANTDDGDLFWQGNNFGQGGGGYNGTGAFTANAWHRFVAAYDMAANPPVVTKYVDGIKQDDWTANQGLDAPRRAMQSYAILFGDGDQDERAVMYVNSVQVRDGKLSDGEMVLLGGPDAAGIPPDIQSVNVAGQWDFDSGNLSATVGKPLDYLDGPDGVTKTGTQFGLTTDLGISDIDGVPAKVMRVPGDLDRNIGYKMFHGISPNGGGTLVNQYTLIMDIYVERTGGGAASLLQTSSLANTDDGDLFWQGNNFGQGGGGYNGTGAFTANGWHRFAAAYDMAATPPVVTKYVDGIKQDDWTANQGLDNPRRAMQSYAVLFGDGDQDERAVMYVNSIQVRPGKLSDAQLALLGGPSASGIPLVLPDSSVTGQWDFNAGSLVATVGKPLDYFDGADGVTKTGTQFGSTTDLGVSDIDGVPASVMRVPGDLDRNIGYKMFHGISPNGGGTLVNQYTLVMDIYVERAGGGAASLLQTSSLANTDDGDLFWQGNNFGQGGGGYNGTGAFTANGWHRFAAAYNMAATPPVVTKYVDGIFQDDWTANQSLDNPRRAMQSYAILFGDGDQDERAVMYVNSIQVRAGALSKSELSALGGPSAGGIPIAFPPAVKTRVSGSLLSLTWATWAQGYIIESATSLDAPTWVAVDGAGLNSVTVNLSEAARFFRLRKP